MNQHIRQFQQAHCGQPQYKKGFANIKVIGAIVLLIGVVGFVFISTRPAPTNPLSDSTPAPVISYADETQYLIFGIKTADVIYEAPKDQTFNVIDKEVEEVITRVGAIGDGKQRQLGFMVILPPWVVEKAMPGKLEWVIKQSFEVAKKRNVAVYFSVISHLVWDSRPDLWNWFDPNQPGYNLQNKKNVEWTDWEGTPVKARYSLQIGTKTKPHMCYNSTQIKSEITRIVSAILAPAIKDGINDLKKNEKEHLFAGLTLTDELSLDDYSVIDQIDKKMGEQMSRDGAAKIRLGYCALTNAGYSKSNPPKDYSDALAKINQEFAAYWGKQFVDAEISMNKLYGHVAAGASGPILQYTNAPIWTAFNDYSRPGWSTYTEGPITDNFNALYQPLKERGSPHWAGTESAPTTLGGETVDPTTYLSWHYNHGATVLMLNAADTYAGGLLTKIIFSPEAVAAYQKFLNGE
ncbi:MAG: hypothetical protein A3C93_06090 [Candidatus Lloydbacteria bacterium RIFCSPHIGHO2_02_FULL_54_17]|uniref:Glycoside hydrolase family 42 N-terminal domain-containing protein n=1 Tax=Candidatus Lloydbacteria bacterium RIFCSPHIGHO2_02_FULL_54_17 TaxID=1798664 RepID=A0A1G2DGB1_9BACT|nr:MAG: hypothetical protein A2762_00825 [Candidatus Lloydbacteria bacterium RIFCSPHIGHO2_01_FULL_54_11]OGZ12649.1 MAG: hypothetical protein A3C93_06090 [Candidatus Lloydbacteria bacterium RIFCSPHIGHO2_02_FULL_54_17]OGZ13501.1 MAG: hypothetical protein A2948_04755 [Candidatus Lloydbacteria bacterium RIFCSPLOWO2_01_FULL_54_18]OGZ16173.1 MAG: hypothetical protein A3H76_03590 [Candidatus Lloydbacteria bacterium RIFCSPLOWO2_02_FULL_54_12]